MPLFPLQLAGLRGVEVKILIPDIADHKIPYLDFISKVEDMFIDDFSKARKMTSADIDDKSFWFKLKVRAARLTAPVQ